MGPFVAQALADKYRTGSELAGYSPRELAWVDFVLHVTAVRAMAVGNTEIRDDEEWFIATESVKDVLAAMSVLRAREEACQREERHEFAASSSVIHALQVVQKYMYGEHCDHAKCRQMVDAALAEAEGKAPPGVEFEKITVSNDVLHASKSMKNIVEQIVSAAAQVDLECADYINKDSGIRIEREMKDAAE